MVKGQGGEFRRGTVNDPDGDGLINQPTAESFGKLKNEEEFYDRQDDARSKGKPWPPESELNKVLDNFGKSKAADAQKSFLENEYLVWLASRTALTADTTLQIGAKFLAGRELGWLLATFSEHFFKGLTTASKPAAVTASTKEGGGLLEDIAKAAGVGAAAGGGSAGTAADAKKQAETSGTGRENDVTNMLAMNMLKDATGGKQLTDDTRGKINKMVQEWGDGKTSDDVRTVLLSLFSGLQTVDKTPDDFELTRKQTDSNGGTTDTQTLLTDALLGDTAAQTKFQRAFKASVIERRILPDVFPDASPEQRAENLYKLLFKCQSHDKTPPGAQMEFEQGLQLEPGRVGGMVMKLGRIYAQFVDDNGNPTDAVLYEDLAVNSKILAELNDEVERVYHYRLHTSAVKDISQKLAATQQASGLSAGQLESLLKLQKELTEKNPEISPVDIAETALAQVLSSPQSKEKGLTPDALNTMDLLKLGEISRALPIIGKALAKAQFKKLDAAEDRIRTLRDAGQDFFTHENLAQHSVTEGLTQLNAYKKALDENTRALLPLFPEFESLWVNLKSGTIQGRLKEVSEQAADAGVDVQDALVVDVAKHFDVMKTKLTPDQNSALSALQSTALAGPAVVDAFKKFLPDIADVTMADGKLSLIIVTESDANTGSTSTETVALDQLLKNPTEEWKEWLAALEELRSAYLMHEATLERLQEPKSGGKTTAEWLKILDAVNDNRNAVEALEAEQFARSHQALDEILGKDGEGEKPDKDTLKKPTKGGRNAQVNMPNSPERQQRLQRRAERRENREKLIAAAARAKQEQKVEELPKEKGKSSVIQQLGAALGTIFGTSKPNKDMQDAIKAFQKMNNGVKNLENVTPVNPGKGTKTGDLLAKRIKQQKNNDDNNGGRKL